MKEEREFKQIYRRDMKNYRSQEDEALFGKAIILLIIVIIFAAIAYTSNQQYEECLVESKSVTLCGGGNTK